MTRTLAEDLREMAETVRNRAACWPTMDPEEAPLAAVLESAAILEDAARVMEREAKK